MAYILKLTTETCARCAAIATREVFNRYNASCGKYCMRHAQLKQIELESAERESDKAVGER